MKRVTFFMAAMLLFMGTMVAQQTDPTSYKEGRIDEVPSTNLKNIPPELVRPSAVTSENYLRGVNSDVYYGYGSTTTLYKATLSSFPGTALPSSGTQIQASEYINGTLYVVTYSSGNTFGTVNQTTGAITVIKNNFSNDAVSLCYNPANGMTYVFGWNGGSFGTVNLTTGAYTHIASMPTGDAYTMYAAIDNNGVCYAVRNTTNEFGTINLATGVFTLIANVSNTANYIQELSIDRETNELYWLSYNISSQCELYKIDKATGTLTNIATVSVGANPTVFSIATDVPVNCDPAGNLLITTSGSTVNLSWTAAPGSPTGYRVDYDGTTVATITATSYTHDNIPDGLHIYTVTALYSENCIPLGISGNVIIGDMCIIRIDMQDDYSDGWENSHIEVTGGGTTYGTATVPTDSYAATAFIVVPSGQLEFSWLNMGGTYDDECSFQIYDINDVMIFECLLGEALYYSGQFFSYQNDCGITIPEKPENFAIVSQDCDLTMTWDAPAGVTGITYNVYKAGTLVASKLTTTTYTTSVETTQVFEWCVETMKDALVSAERACASNTACGVGIGTNTLDHVTITPNPASTTIHIKGDVSKVEIYSTLGQLIETHTGDVSVVDVSTYSAGIYFLKLYNANNETITKKQIIHR